METIIERLRDEIVKPIYVGKTASEIADMINSPTEEGDAVVFVILNGIAGAPNLITEEDVINAQ